MNTLEDANISKFWWGHIDSIQGLLRCPALTIGPSVRQLKKNIGEQLRVRTRSRPALAIGPSVRQLRKKRGYPHLPNCSPPQSGIKMYKIIVFIPILEFAPLDITLPSEEKRAASSVLYKLQCGFVQTPLSVLYIFLYKK